MPPRRRKRKAKPGTIARRKHFDSRRAALLVFLGGKCVGCGSVLDLTFDHIHGRDWEIRKVHSTKRLRLYWDEARDGLLQLLCLTCNSEKGRPEGEEVAFVNLDEYGIPVPF